MFIVVNSCKHMSRTVSARISKETHEKLRERCNKVGCSMNDFIEACIEFILNNYSEFDFGDEEENVNNESSMKEKDSLML